MNLLGQIIVSSAEFGAAYALLCLGITVIYKTSGILNFAAGAIGTIGAYAYWGAVSAWQLNTPAALLLGLVAGATTGVAVYLALVRPIESGSLMGQIILTLGALLIMVGVLGYAFGFATHALPQLGGDIAWTLSGLSYTARSLGALAAALVCALLVHLIYDKLPLGLRMRAIAQDADVAQLVGIARVRHVAISWAIGNALGTLGIIVAATNVGLTPNVSDNLLLYVAAALVLGGFGSLPGALVGGFAIGVGANLISGFLSPSYSFPLLFIFLIVILYLRPDGLLGEKAWTRP